MGVFFFVWFGDDGTIHRRTGGCPRPLPLSVSSCPVRYEYNSSSRFALSLPCLFYFFLFPTLKSCRKRAAHIVRPLAVWRSNLISWYGTRQRQSLVLSSILTSDIISDVVKLRLFLCEDEASEAI